VSAQARILRKSDLTVTDGDPQSRQVAGRGALFCSCSRIALGIRRRRRRSHRIARRRAAEERVDTLLVGERRQSRRLPGAIRGERQRAIKQRKERLRSLLLRASARDFRRLQLAASSDSQTPAVGCSLSTVSSVVSAIVCLPRTAEKVQNLFSRNDSGVTIAIVINCAQ
jgi:hypothetical protein